MNQLSDTTRRRMGYFLVFCAAVFVVTHVAISTIAGIGTDEVADNLVLGLVFVSVLVLSIRAVPRNGAVWALLWGAFFGALGEAAQAVAAARTGFSPSDLEFGSMPVSPSSLDLWSALAVNLSLWVWLPGVFAVAIHLVILFPSGRSASPGWRWIAWTSGVMIGLMASAIALANGPWVDVPYHEISTPAEDLTLPLLVIAIASAIHMFIRFRRSSGVERLQFRWVAWAMGLNVITLFGFVGGPLEILGLGLGTITLAAVPVSIGIAITRYRLFDIDVVISRTLVFVVLVGFITVVYAGVVVGVGSVVGGSSLGWSVAATGFVAVVFEPVRDRVQRWINRLVYGRRATPYEVLSDLTGRLAATEREEGLLGRMAQRLAEGTGADRAIVWTVEGSGFVAVASEPSSGRPLEPVVGLGEIPGWVVPIVHDGERLGGLSVETRRGDALTPMEAKLVEDLAGSAGLLMRRLRLDAELEQKAQELEESRRRLVDAQDVERRRLERELNEGAQQRVVALKVRLALAQQQAIDERSERTAALLAQVAAQTQEAIDQIRALANGIYPPVLEAEGLRAAVGALGELAPVEVRVRCDVSHRYPLPIEGAVYFCISEALTNAVKHGAAPISVDISEASGELKFSVSDSGPGFDPNTVERGSGLNNMADRLDALAGGIIIDTIPGRPTTLTGRLPVPAEVPA